MDSTTMKGAGSWSAYWYNGVIVSSEIARGLDILALQPSGFISANELAAAKSVHLDYLNVQGQPKLWWPPSFAVARAALARAEHLSGQQRKDALTQLATQLSGDAPGAADQTKVQTLAAAVTDLANATR